MIRLGAGANAGPRPTQRTFSQAERGPGVTMRKGAVVRDTTGGLCRVKTVDGDIALVKAITPRGVEQGTAVRREVAVLTPDPYAQGYIYGFNYGRTGMGAFSSSDQLADPAMQDGYEDGYQDGWAR